MIAQLGRLILFGSGIYHVTMGVACFAGRAHIARFIHALYKIQLPEAWKDALDFVILPLGAFAVWTGAVCLVAYFRPGSWTPGVQLSLALLFAMRVGIRIFYRSTFDQVFGVNWSRNLINIAFNSLLIVLLIAGCVAGSVE